MNGRFCFTYSFILLFGILNISKSAVGQSSEEKFKALFDSRAKGLLSVQNVMQRTFKRENWCSSGAQCNTGKCINHACNGDNYGDEHICNELNPAPDVCGEKRSDFCEKSESPNGILLNKKTASIRTDKNTISVSSNNSFTIDNIHLKRDVCAMKAMEADMVRAYNEENFKYWLYAGSTNGAFITMPGRASVNCKDGLENCGYNPTRRPWFIRASSGPKDVIILYDSTSRNENSLLTALDSQDDSPLLDSLSPQDFISVVAFGPDSESVKVLGSSSSLEKNSPEHIKSIIEELRSIPKESGRPDLKAGIQKAFDLFEDGIEKNKSSSCSRVLVVLLGKEDICFEKCSATGPCSCVEQTRKHIKELQNNFSKDPISIVFFTEGNNNNVEKLSRTIVCDEKNKGLWRRVTNDDSADTLLSSYSQLIAANLFQDQTEIIPSQPYWDASGLGTVVTVSLPVYVDRKIVGVAATDIPILELMQTLNVNNETAIQEAEKISDSGKCYDKHGEENGCILQELRNADPDSRTCADIYSPNFECYHFGISTFIHRNEEVTWAQAQTECKKFHSSGKLAVVTEQGVNAFLAGFSSADGSWIGGRNKNSGFKWEEHEKENDISEEHVKFGYDRPIGEMVKEAQNIFSTHNDYSCLSLDRRGVQGNWNVEPCDVLRSYICEIPDETQRTSSGDMIHRAADIEICHGSTFTVDDPSHKPVNPITGCLTGEKSSGHCNDDDDKEMKQAEPLCSYSGKDFTAFDKTCCGGKTDGNYVEKRPLPLFAIILIAIGGLIFLIFAALAIIYWRRYNRHTRNARRGQSDTESDEERQY